MFMGKKKTTSAEVDPNDGLGRESLQNALVDSGLGMHGIIPP